MVAAMDRAATGQIVAVRPADQNVIACATPTSPLSATSCSAASSAAGDCPRDKRARGSCNAGSTSPHPGTLCKTPDYSFDTVSPTMLVPASHGKPCRRGSHDQTLQDETAIRCRPAHQPDDRRLQRNHDGGRQR